MTDSTVLGAGAALASAAAWALGIVLWRQIGDVLSPLSINLNKCLIGVGYLSLASLLVGLQPIDRGTLFYLALSGVLGIALADSFFMASLILLGSRKASLIGTLSPIVTTVAAVVVLGERPKPVVWLGGCLTVAGVAWVLGERHAAGATEKTTWLGLRAALLSLGCTAVAVVLAKKGIAHAPALEGTLIRMGAGSLGLVVWIAFRHNLREHVRPLWNGRLLKKISLTVLVSTFGGFWLSLVALKHVDASIASILGSTTPLFVLPLVAVTRREEISARAVVGAIAAVAGVAFVVATV
jgi:drug/metabolite transporter (DMT)-like permease